MRLSGDLSDAKHSEFLVLRVNLVLSIGVFQNIDCFLITRVRNASFFPCYIAPPCLHTHGSTHLALFFVRVPFFCLLFYIGLCCLSVGALFSPSPELKNVLFSPPLYVPPVPLPPPRWDMDVLRNSRSYVRSSTSNFSSPLYFENQRL